MYTDKTKVSKLQMIKSRDGVKTGSVLPVQLLDGKLATKHNGTVFREPWILKAIAQGKAKPIFKCYALM